MENNYQPLPSNYVSFAQLQERWLKQKELEKEKEKEKEEQIKQEQEQQKQQPKLHQYNPRQRRQPQPKGHQRAWRVIQTGGADENRRHKKFGPQNWDSSRSNHFDLGDDGEKGESLEAKTNMGDENAGPNGKRGESKKEGKKLTGKPREDKEDDCEKRKSLEAKIDVGDENAGPNVKRGERKKEGKKVTGKPREDKEDHCEKHKSLEAKTDVGAENAGPNGKRGEPKKALKKVTGKPREDKEENKLGEDAAQSTMKDDKMQIKSELNDESNNLKLGKLTMNSVSEKQNGRLRGHYNYRSFHGSQRNYGGRFREQHVQRKQRGEKMVWVRKNEDSAGNVGVY